MVLPQGAWVAAAVVVELSETTVPNVVPEAVTEAAPAVPIVQMEAGTGTTVTVTAPSVDMVTTEVLTLA